jgi:hypothetical protein
MRCHPCVQGRHADLVGYSRTALEEISIRDIESYKDFARDYARPDTPILVGGAIRPRGDVYDTGHKSAQRACN